MYLREMTCRPATASAATRRGPSTSSNSSFKRTVAFWLVSAVLVANVIRFAECRAFQEDPQNDGPDGSEDDESESPVVESEGGKDNKAVPIILTTGLSLEVKEGSDVNLPCKVPEKFAKDYIMLWINGTKSIMTDTTSTSTDPRVKAGAQAPMGSVYVENTLVIEQVTRFDSGSYTCRLTSEPPVEITHTLRVIHPAKILSVQTTGGSKPQQNTSTVKKLMLKQGDAVQLECIVDGYPEPTVQWTKRARYNQQQSTAAQQSSGIESSPVPATVVVSHSKDVRIESVSAYRDTGYYECTAHNAASMVTVSEDGTSANTARSGIELEIDYQPEVTVPRLVVNTGETYTAHLICTVSAFPKPKVTWEKEVNGSSSWKTLVNDGPDSRYEIIKQTNAAATAANPGQMSAGMGYLLKVKQVGTQDFGRYRCFAENKIGSTRSEIITLTGSPARPQLSYVQVKSGIPELGLIVDSWSPVAEYQLQYKQQQDSQVSWTDVRPQPQVVEPSNNQGDERRYTVSYTFGDGQHHQQQAGESTAVPPTLQHGVTYVARLRALNVHGWSDWSQDVVFSGGIDEDQNANEITQQDGHQHKDDQVLKSSIGSSGVSQYCSATTTTVVLAVSAMVATAASIC